MFGRLIPTTETVGKIDAVTIEDVQRVATRIFSGKPTLASLGPVSHLPSLDSITGALAA